MAELSEKARKLFEGPNYLFVATVNADGSRQVTPVWTSLRNGHITFNTAVGNVKDRNLRRDPRIGLSITARDDPWDKADIRGRVVDFIEGSRPKRTSTTSRRSTSVSVRIRGDGKGNGE